MNTRPFRPFAQPIRLPFMCHAASASSHAVRSLASSSVAALRLRWKAKVERRRQHRFAGELRAMSNHMLRDIGVGHSAIGWVVRRDR